MLKNTPRRVCAALVLLFPIMIVPAAAQSGGVSLSYLPSSSVKLEQVIGDCDFQAQAQQIVKGQAVTCLPTTSRTVTRFNILGNGQGGAFEADGKMIFFFGDTISKDASVVNYHAADPIAWSTSTDPEAGLLLNFYTISDGSPLFVKPPGITMGPDDIPNSGISLNGQIYFICNTGSDTSLANPQAPDFSVLVQFDGVQTFTAGRTISPTGGRFIGTSLRASGTNVFIFGAGPYRASDIYLQMVPASSFASGVGTQYFAGLVNGQPTWVNSEAGAVPVVEDNPLNGPAWPNDSPTVGNLSVVYSSALNLWLMTYDGGRQSNKTRGIYFTYAPQPWGPWATPQLIFNDVRDNAYGLGGFIHDPSIVPDPPGDGLNGPVIGSNDPYLTAGGSFAPLMIERFITVAGSTLKIYYNLSTWNPYTIVRMRSEFEITQINSGGVVNNASYSLVSSAVAPGAIAAVFGTNLTDGTSCLPPSCNPTFGSNGTLNTTMAGAQVTVNGTPAPIFYASPAQLGIQIPFEVTGASATVVASVAGQAGTTPATIAVAPVSPGIFTATADGKGAGAITHVNGSAVTTQNPAQPGELVILYATGLGPVAPAVPTGALPAVASSTVSPVTVTIGGIGVVPDFAGLAGCCVGLNQINFHVPAGVTPGNAVPIMLTIAGQSSNTATIAVQ